MRRVRKLILCFSLGLAALYGQPLIPDEIEELMRSADQPRLVQVLRAEDLDDHPLGGTWIIDPE
jgi:hypothetical protein